MRSAPVLLGAYMREIARGALRYSLNWRDVIRSFRPWWGSTKNQERTAVGDRMPWLTYRALRYLEGFIYPGARVFEYGVGGSTVYFLDKGVSLVSVEHDAEWVAQVAEVCDGDWTPHVVLPAPEAPEDEFRSAMIPGSFRDYVTTIGRYGEFDFILIDGRARSACLREAHPHLSRHGHLVFDNSERSRYFDAFAEIGKLGLRRYDFFGPGPYNLFFWQTTIWTPLCRRLSVHRSDPELLALEAERNHLYLEP